jgi:hypothetical protein
MKTVPLLALLVAACAYGNAVGAKPDQTCVGRRILAVSNNLGQSIDVYVNNTSNPTSSLLGPVDAKHNVEFAIPANVSGAYARPTGTSGFVASSWRASSQKQVRFDFKCAAA